MSRPPALDRFRTVLASATRAVARDAEADIAFATDGNSQSGKLARVVSPGAGLDAGLVAEARGAADAMALRLRFSDPGLHTARSPGGDGDAQQVFDVLEIARVEALGAKSFPGVRSNLAALTESRARSDARRRGDAIT